MRPAAPGRLRPALAPALIAAALACAPAAAQPVKSGPLAGGEVVFRFHSTIVGRLEGTAPIDRAQFAGTDLSAVRGMAEVRVDRMLTGNGGRDRHLREVMEADKYPIIRFDLRSVRPDSGGDSVGVALEGDLTLHGVTRAVTARGWVVRRAGGVALAVSFPLDMRDYGIKPPVRALVFRVGPDVVVEARLTFAAAPPNP